MQQLLSGKEINLNLSFENKAITMNRTKTDVIKHNSNIDDIVTLREYATYAHVLMSNPVGVKIEHTHLISFLNKVDMSCDSLSNFK